jgi:hypothetical protein
MCRAHFSLIFRVPVETDDRRRIPQRSSSPVLESLIFSQPFGTLR